MSKFLSVFFLLFSLTALAQEGRNVSKYNLSQGVGLKGYDPVAVFPEGGGAPQKGITSHRVVHSGVTYLFASEENEKRFQADPEKYEPTYGGWCAYAMASGSTVDIQPHLFTIHGRRAHYFVAARAKQSFDRNLMELEKKADDNWKKISGESPRR